MTLLDVPDFPGYLVGDDGSVWSKWKLRPAIVRSGNERYLSDTLRQMKCKKATGGHVRVTLFSDGKCPEGKECCHRDGIKTNNCVGNLYWGTRAENTQDAIRHGTFYNATKAAAIANRKRKLQP